MRKLECDDTYSVWRRFPDGYVDATAYWPRNYTTWVEPGGDGTRWEYELLLSTRDWELARARIIVERVRDAVGSALGRLTPAEVGKSWVSALR